MVTRGRHASNLSLLTAAQMRRHANGWASNSAREASMRTPSTRRHPIRCPRTQSPTAPPMASRIWQMPWSSLRPGSPMPNFSLLRVESQMIERNLEASNVRCWPHHFDLATLASFPARNADATGYVGAGLSPGESIMTSPISMCRSIPDRTVWRCRACRSSAIGIRTSSRRLLCRLTRLLRPIIKKLRPMNS
jgi:hypothetical protein